MIVVVVQAYHVLRAKCVLSIHIRVCELLLMPVDYLSSPSLLVPSMLDETLEYMEERQVDQSVFVIQIENRVGFKLKLKLLCTYTVN